MDFVVDNQKTVVVAVWQLDEFDFRILCVMLLQISEKLFVITGVDGRWNAIGPLCKHRKHPVVDEIVDKDNSLLGASNEFGDIGPCIPDAAGREELLGKELGANVLDPIKYNLDRFVCLLLMLLNVEDSLYNLRVVINELRYHGESPHNANVDFHGSVRP